MRIDETKRALLAGQINENAGQNGVLEDVGKIAGMKGVAIVDRNDPPIPRPSDLPERRRRVDLDDLAAFDTDGAREQLESLADHLAVGSTGSFRHLEPDAVWIDAQLRAFSTAGTPPEKR